MSGIQFIRLVLRHAKLIFGVAVGLSVLVAHLTKDEKLSYSSQAMINTGIISGYNPESSSSSKVDREYVLTEIANLIEIASSFATLEELGTTLLVEVMMMKNEDPNQLLDYHWKSLLEAIPEPTWDSLIDYRSYNNSYKNVTTYRSHNIDNPIYEIIYSKHPLFGVDQLKSLRVTRIGRSDMLKYTYTTMDPWICQRTLELAIELLTRKHKQVKEGQSSNVLGFFKDQTDLSARRLRNAEEALKQFREDSRIINYYEQTRFISSKKEELDERYQQEYQQQVAARAIINRIEKQLEKRVNLSRIHQTIQNQRDSLETLTKHLTFYELFKSPNSNQEAEIKATQQDIDRLKASMTGLNNAAYEVQISPEGMALEDLMTEWLKNIVIVEETQARMKVIEIQKKEFQDVYQKFAPLGSKLKRLERTISVAEQEYLENIHSKNQAQLHQQSILMSTNLKIVDRPIFPAEPNGSSRMMLIAVAGIAGFVLTLATILALEFFDSTLKTPKNIQKTIDLELIGALPKFPPPRSAFKVFIRKLFLSDHGQSKIDFKAIKDLSIGLILQNIQINFFKSDVYLYQKVFAIMSMRRNEGKSFLCQLFTERLRFYDERVLYLIPHLHYFSEDLIHSEVNESLEALLSEHEDNVAYIVKPSFFEINHLTQLPLEEEVDWEKYTYVILELPPLLKHPFPTQVLAKADLSLLVCRSNRVWNKADEKLLEKLLEGIPKPPGIILNGTREENLESIIGELPKKRSWIRKTIKKILLFRYKEKNTV